MGLIIKAFRKVKRMIPGPLQVELKRLHYKIQIRKGKFITKEPEYKILDQIITPGSWVIDVGANVGHYTKMFSDLAGSSGRVIAFEPVSTTFSLLTANTQLFKHGNVTLINAGASDKLNVVGMSIPKFSNGDTNYYQAHISESINNEISSLITPIDALNIREKVSLIKIDVEGHELHTLAGMKETIQASKPFLIIETSSKKIISDLAEMGYVSEKLKGSPNIVFRPTDSQSHSVQGYRR